MFHILNKKNAKICQSKFFDKYSPEKINEHASIMKDYGERGYKGYIKSGVVIGKFWMAGNGACDVCLENVKAGKISLKELFPSGHLHPPAGTSCRCTLGADIKPD